MIFTLFGPKGTKERRPVGYSGEQCNQATAPYEKRDVGMSKTLTPEALQEPAKAEQTVHEAAHA